MTNGQLIGTSRPPALADELANVTHEQFARALAEHGNATRAYRECFNVATSTASSSVNRTAYNLAHRPDVAARVRALTALAAETTLISTRSRMVALQRIVEADPTEVASIRGLCCRHCHGKDYGYQWRNAAEFARALDKYGASLKGPKPLPMPDASGGFGFVGTHAPNRECPHCMGDGITRVSLTPSDELSPGARALIKSIRQKADGSIEVQLHDKLTASDQLNRMAGVYVEKSVHLNIDIKPLSPDMSHADMLDLIESVRPSTTP